jgi:hypothetical protein
MANDQRGASRAAAGAANKAAKAKAANQRVIGESPFSRYVRIMSEVTDIVVPVLQKIQAQLGRLETGMANIKEDMHHIKVRMTSIEENFVSVNPRMDHFGVRLERIERRLDLVEA